MTTTEDLLTGDVVLQGRIMQASNATFVASIGEVKVVYKPVAGERPLWDFPRSTLAPREVAAYVVSQALGWNLVPRTWLREGPLGIGMVQLWREPDPAQEVVILVPAGEVPAQGWYRVLEGVDEHDQPVALCHEDAAALRRMAVFDVVVNNADRKGGHVLGMPDGHRYGVDHGLTFHTEHKLRTILWGWVGQELDGEELKGLRRLRAALDDDVGDQLGELLTGPEVEALVLRCEALLETPRFPAPSGEMPAIPWPPL